MARRIALTVIALIAVLLGLITVPLGLITASQDRQNFRSETSAAATTMAGVAEEHLGDHTTGAPLRKAISELKRKGDQVAVYDRSGTWIAGTQRISGVTGALIRQVLRDPVSIRFRLRDRILVISPVRHDLTADTLGAVALSRSAEDLDHRIDAIWAWVGIVSVAGMLAAILVGTALARWLSRPLAGLEAAARQLGDGAFRSRAPAGQGPQEVRRLASNFNQMAARLETLVDGHNAMMADVSHQLRTPLAALRLRLDVLAQDMPATITQEVADAQEEVARLSRMVDGLLAAARAENVSTAPVPVSVALVIRDRVAAWKPTAEEKPVRLSATEVEPLYARLGEGHLEQVLDNLLANALDAVPPGGHIWVSATSEDDMVKVIVADDGPGMSGQRKHAAFRRYVSATPGGTGLGLAIVHRLVTSSGGTADLSDTPGGGLTVTLSLPEAPRERMTRRTAGNPAGSLRDL